MVTITDIQQHCPTLPLHPQTIPQLNWYITELTCWNSQINLIGKSLNIEEEIYHTLGAYTHLPSRAQRVADVGSGNGIVGVPLAIMAPHLRMHLIERSRKKSAFLATVRAHIPSITLITQDYRQLTMPFDAVMFRALTPLTPHSVAQIINLVAEGGSIIAYKGAQSQAEARYLRPYFRQVLVHKVNSHRTIIVAHSRTPSTTNETSQR